MKFYTILVVGNDDDLIQSLESILQVDPYNDYNFESSDGLAYIDDKLTKNSYDLIFVNTGSNLPDPVTLVQQIKSIDAYDTPIVVFSVSEDHKLMSRLKACGVDDVVSKSSLSYPLLSRVVQWVSRDKLNDKGHSISIERKLALISLNLFKLQKSLAKAESAKPMAAQPGFNMSITKALAWAHDNPKSMWMYLMTSLIVLAFVAMLIVQYSNNVNIDVLERTINSTKALPPKERDPYSGR